MRHFAILAGFALSMGVGAFGAAQAATVHPYQHAVFDAAQKGGEPILIFVEASWCPTLRQGAADSPATLRSARIREPRGVRR